MKRSLHTSDPFTARIRALEWLKVVTMAVNKPKLTDFNFSDVKRYEIDTVAGTYKAEGEEDHQRMMDALKQINAQTQPKTEESKKALSGLTPPGQRKVGLKLAELVTKFFLMKSQHSETTRYAYQGATAEFAKLLKNPNVTDITQSDITTYIEWLFTKKTNPRTVDNKIGALRSLINFAKKHGYFFGENPAAGRNILTKKQKLNADAPTWESTHIQQFFGSENFKKLRETEPDFYYICLLGVLTGIRVSALASIKKADLMVALDGVSYIKIRKDKTSAGTREVPISAEIYQEIQKFLADREHLFNYSERVGAQKGSSDPIRKRLEKLKTEIKLDGLGLNFHGFRKFFNNFLLQNEVPFEARCQYIGHEIDHVNVATYGKKFSTAKLGSLIIPIQERLLAQIRPHKTNK